MRGLPELPITATAGLSNFCADTFDPRTMGQVGSGKGLDQISAHIGAVGEALERYSAARYRLSDCNYATMAELKGDYIDPQGLVLYSPAQYQSTNFPFTPFNSQQKIHWSQGRWLGSNTPVWVPSLVSYFNFFVPLEEQFGQVSSNGLAAGQSHSDAALRASYELIERDAIMLTWHAQLPCQRLKIDTQYQGIMRVLIDDMSKVGIKLELYLLDVGIKVPTVVCLGLGNGLTSPAVSVALSTHGDLNIAMKKAILEQSHVAPYLCSKMAKKTPIPKEVSEVTSIEDHAAYYFAKDKLSAFDFIRQSEDQAKEVNEFNYQAINNEQDLAQRLDDAGVSIAIIDTTAPDIALSPYRVARAVGTHIQPIHFGEQFKRIDNPRLRQLLKGRAVNENPQPVA
jgi:ribosomal protein S12 methylthiotransferase accessory factor